MVMLSIKKEHQLKQDTILKQLNPPRDVDITLHRPRLPNINDPTGMRQLFKQEKIKEERLKEKRIKGV